MQESMPVNKIISVTGPIDVNMAGITDAHNHVWIESVLGALYRGPVLNNRDAIIHEIKKFHQAGGQTIVDCQPGGCGRNGWKLLELSKTSKVNIIASTGFHLQRYYPVEFWIFRSSVDKAYIFFLDELTKGLMETQISSEPVKAGIIKIAFEEKLEKSPLLLVQAAVYASLETGAALEVHIETGSNIEKIVNTLFDYGISANKLVLCHIDKIVDFGLHSTLAQEGILLEYDTFFRKKYFPDENVWPLLISMVEAGYSSQICLATDMADSDMWMGRGGSPGLIGFMDKIIPRLVSLGIDNSIINQLTGFNIANCIGRQIN
jgi:5-phospho-D-xylono-1,4-lactonase